MHAMCVSSFNVPRLCVKDKRERIHLHTRLARQQRSMGVISVLDNLSQLFENAVMEYLWFLYELFSYLSRAVLPESHD